MRSQLRKVGLYRESAREHFNGSLVFPIFDAKGSVSEIYGRRVTHKKSGICHLYLPGPHRGIWNPDCLRSPEIILTESVIDALTFWVNGFENITCIYGTEGFIDDHLEAFKRHKTQRVYLAYDRDKAGDRAAERDASRLQSVGIECFRVKFPAGHDANEYALKVTPAPKSLKAVIVGAQWLGRGACTPSSFDGLKDQAVESKTKESESNNESRTPSSLVEIAANVSSSGVEAAEEDKRAELKSVGEDYALELGERSYRVRGLQKNGSLEVLTIFG